MKKLSLDFQIILLNGFRSKNCFSRCVIKNRDKNQKKKNNQIINHDR